MAWIERYNSSMKQDVVLQTLKQKNAELTKQFGVKSLQLFGSVARNEATSTSDVDLLVEFNRPVWDILACSLCRITLKNYSAAALTWGLLTV